MKHLMLLGFLLCFVFSCAPTMKDFAKIQANAYSPEEKVRLEAVKKTGSIKGADPETVLPFLFDMLQKDASPRVRAESAKSLVNLGFPESLEPVIQCVEKDASGIVRFECVKYLGIIKSSRGADVLRDTIPKDPDPGVRAAAVLALGAFKDPADLKLFKKTVENDSSFDVKSAAITAAGGIYGSESMALLVEALKKPLLMESAIKSIADNKRGGESSEAVGIIVSLVDRDPQKMEKHHVIEILIQSKDPRLKQTFRRYYNDPNASRQVITNSANRMGQAGDTSLVPELIGDLQNAENKDVQINLITSLAAFRDGRAAPILLSMLSSARRNPGSSHCKKLERSLVWALGAGGLWDIGSYRYLCDMCCNEPDETLRLGACVASSDIYLHHTSLSKEQKCPCWNR